MKKFDKKDGPTVADRKVSRDMWRVCKKDEMDGEDLQMSYFIKDAMKPERDAAQRLVDELKEASASVCSLCKKVNPQHDDDRCMCDEKESIDRAIKAYKKEVRV